MLVYIKYTSSVCKVSFMMIIIRVEVEYIKLTNFLIELNSKIYQNHFKQRIQTIETDLLQSDAFTCQIYTVLN